MHNINPPSLKRNDRRRLSPTLLDAARSFTYDLKSVVRIER